ncbi:hypothetical protein F4811DRAFT_273158 [Daldinia bambusicola]|nr:hypothetical protein F4811DRAFT_273158 [Daldinia bambusicola]
MWVYLLLFRSTVRPQCAYVIGGTMYSIPRSSLLSLQSPFSIFPISNSSLSNGTFLRQHFYYFYYFVTLINYYPCITKYDCPEPPKRQGTAIITTFLANGWRIMTNAYPYYYLYVAICRMGRMR